ncbi:hypothetical protein OsJ_09202 [Oryza sativa Japonica Group]|uniref:SURP motif domain-containing protein n=3 Tax=Oryza sativa subsp. japonica TaxID=39947 RepID=B9FAI0_ORYSJ|nr:hypothetical protein OsJ_09202 [Oryza sativa Japonica Group]
MEAPSASASAEERQRIERVARFVARDRDGDMAEALLLRLLKITRNARRWGFLDRDHPLHPYYLQQKVSEQCRILRPRPAAAAADFVTEIANSFIPCHSVADPSVRPQRQLFRRLPHLVTLVTGAGVGQTLGELEGLELGLRHGWEEPVVSNLAKQQQLIVHRYSLWPLAGYVEVEDAVNFFSELPNDSAVWSGGRDVCGWPRLMDPLESEGGSQKSNNKPKYSKFTQQELPACKPLLTPGIVVATFLLIGIIFVPIGLASLSASQEIVELVDRYDTNCVSTLDKVGFIQNTDTDKTCTRTLTVPKHMKSPIQIYYQIGDFYQNHRRYVKSRSDKQLRYKNAVHLTKDCDPEGNTVDGAPIIPCGLIAWSLFNDTYTISVNKKAIEVNKKDIAWKSDKTDKFGSDIYPSNFQKGSLIGGAKLNESIPLSEQEDLIVWMRTAALPTFRKLYGRIETDIMANDQLTVVIQNNYNTYSFGGSKALVLSTTSWIGGKNNFIGVAYLTIGGLCIFLAVGFVVLLYMVKPRTLGDPSYLSWNRDTPDRPN